MKYLLILLLLAGCSTTVPVTVNFPEAPGRILVKCPNLEKLKDDPKISDISKTITVNYTTYYECVVKHDAFIEWYQIQKHIFENLK